MARRRLLLVPLLLLALPLALPWACSGGSSSAARLRPESTGLRIAAPTTGGGEADALAAALELSAGTPVQHEGRPAFAPAVPGLRDELRFRADAHLDAIAFAAGLGGGPSLEGSERIRRLAAEPNAPPDRNGNQSNLDETMAEDLLRLHDMAGGGVPPGLQPLLAPWGDCDPDLAAPLGSAGRHDLAAQRLQSNPAAADARPIEVEELGHAMLARTLVAERLLVESRGSLAGATPEEGMRGLLLLQQVAALEETLLGGWFHDGRGLSRLREPANYDPTSGLRWLPRTVNVTFGRPGVIEGVAARDQAAELGALASVLRAASELAWLASPANPHPTLRDLFAGHPFGEAAPPRPGRGARPLASVIGLEVTFEDVKPLLDFRCLSCHSGSLPQGGFRVDSYENVLLGGNHRATLPTVVLGDHTRSLLWQVLVGVSPVLPRMPQGCLPGVSCMPPGEVSIVADWIDMGALREPTTRQQARIGRDLAVVLWRDLRAMHLGDAQSGATAGALHHRHEGDGRSQFEDARATGAALVALAAFVHAVPEETEAPAVLARVADHVAAHLVDAEGLAFAGMDLATGTPTGSADLGAQAALCEGLYAAGRALQRQDLTDRANAMARLLLSRFFDQGAHLFRGAPGAERTEYRPALLAQVLGALREAAAAGVPGAVDAHDEFLVALRPVLAFAEWDGRGEVLGDGIADTDGNGVPEPALAGGENGRLPLLAGSIVVGPAGVGGGAGAGAADEPITWSRHVLPLFQSACTGCHVLGANMGQYRLDTRQLASTPGESQGQFPLIVPGDPEASLLYRKLVDRRPPIGMQMPQARPPLDARGKELVRRWILEGATGR